MEPSELSSAECADLLRTDVVGRLAFVTPAGPRIVPVNYAVGDGCLIFRTTAWSELASFGPGREVAFEIDHLDADRRRGWSVVVQGTCARLSDREARELADLGSDPDVWIPTQRTTTLQLIWTSMSGRRVGGQHWPHPVVSGRARSY